MRGAEFVRRVQRAGRRSNLNVCWVAERGKVRDLKDEIPKGALPSIAEAIGIDEPGPGIKVALQSFRYPARLNLGNDGAITIKFRDLPEAITWGHDTDDALYQAADCIDEAIAGRLRRGGSIPRPSKSRAGEILVDVPARTAAKAALYLAMKDAGVRPIQLARKLSCNEKDIQRLLDPRQAVAFTKLERALNALGKRLILAVDEAA